MSLRHPVSMSRVTYIIRVRVSRLVCDCSSRPRGRGGKRRGIVLQCVVVCCSGCVAVCCSVLQYVAVCCSVLQCVAVCRAKCCSGKHIGDVVRGVAVCCRLLQCVAVCCSVLQCFAVCCSVLHCVVV